MVIQKKNDFQVLFMSHWCNQSPIYLENWFGLDLGTASSIFQWDGALISMKHEKCLGLTFWSNEPILLVMLVYVPKVSSHLQAFPCPETCCFTVEFTLWATFLSNFGDWKMENPWIWCTQQELDSWHSPFLDRDSTSFTDPWTGGICLAHSGYQWIQSRFGLNLYWIWS